MDNEQIFKAIEDLTEAVKKGFGDMEDRYGGWFPPLFFGFSGGTLHHTIFFYDGEAARLRDFGCAPRFFFDAQLAVEFGMKLRSGRRAARESRRTRLHVAKPLHHFPEEIHDGALRGLWQADQFLDEDIGLVRHLRIPGRKSIKLRGRGRQEHLPLAISEPVLVYAKLLADQRDHLA